MAPEDLEPKKCRLALACEIPMAKDLAIVLNNGSVNSAVTTALATQKYRTVMLFAETGDQSVPRSRAAYDLQVAHFKPYREHALPMPFLSLIQPLSEQSATISDPRHPTPIAPQMIELLPLISAALRFAVHYQAAAVYLGCCASAAVRMNWLKRRSTRRYGTS